MCAHLCLGGVWSTRYRKTATEQTNNNNNNNNNNSSTGDMSRHTNTSPATVSSPLLSDKFATIGAFIDHFNRVSFVVQATVLERTATRVKISAYLNAI